MGMAVRYICCDFAFLYCQAASLIKSGDKNTLINLLVASATEVDNPTAPTDYSIIPSSQSTHERLLEMNFSLSEVSTLRKCIEPSTCTGAIALAALVYHIDISRSSVAQAEYQTLVSAGKIGYSPIDRWLSYWYKKNPLLFNLECTFNPLFPRSYYDDSMIGNLIRRSGYTEEHTQHVDAYELLQINHVSPTFYSGAMPACSYTTTLVYIDELTDVPEGELFYYGTFDSVKPVTVSELSGVFSTHQDFTDIFEPGKVFSDTSIRRLLVLLRDSPTESSEQLVRLINDIFKIYSSMDSDTRKFVSLYKNSHNKQIIKDALYKLLHLGMYMRGWAGPGNDFTINNTTHNFGADFIDSMVDKSTREFYELIGTDRCILDLPLVVYKDGQYCKSSKRTDGRTIEDRLKILEQAHQTSNIASCIRLSSNWFCSSAHKYLIDIGESAPFDIFSLRHIS